ncbi:hypothetical protein CSIM01_03413 [Colletotrichum simmondsii]|uniref:Uncharacterized protein n=1 Tax=Colletotrichum simmondsii TaxID=703756 RepID=A0A135SZD4_9PEZI|nr:hypothetical protein CSIM01_03413 [Colletotrichum simmondsii]
MNLPTTVLLLLVTSYWLPRLPMGIHDGRFVRSSIDARLVASTLIYVILSSRCSLSRLACTLRPRPTQHGETKRNGTTAFTAAIRASLPSLPLPPASMQGAFPLDVSLELQPPESNLAVSGPEAWCTKLSRLSESGCPLCRHRHVTALPCSACGSPVYHPYSVLRPRLCAEYRRNGQRPMLRYPRPPVDVISCNQPPGSRPISVPEAKRGDITSEAAIDKARTPNPSNIPNLSRHTEYWGSTTHH